MLWLGAEGVSFTEGTVRSKAQGRRKDLNKRAKLKKRGGTAAPSTQVRLLDSAKRIMLLVVKACTALLPVCIRHATH